MQQEQWINEVMKSLNGLQKQEGNPFLHTRVLAKLQEPTAVKIYGLRPVFILSCLAVVMLLFNIFSWTGNRTTGIEQDAVSIANASNDYELTSTDY
ncbi:MAG: hypothetical protein K2X48_16140 [Chitinophagaceae bacterium]|nr:hypothetical protein [Chitinophagaceae bacterium]